VSALIACTGQIKLGFYLADSQWHLKVECVHIDIVALPRHGRSADGAFESNNIVNKTHRRMLTGNPLGVGERDGAGRSGNSHCYAENAACNRSC